MSRVRGLRYIGSFQSPENRFYSEHPLEEVWAQVARYTSVEYLREHLYPADSQINWREHIEYAAIRAKQAVEFHLAAKDRSLLTSPLVFYYSFLNLTRAFMALGPEVLPSPRHGLKFIKREDLLSSEAILIKGTFTEYLDAFGFGSTGNRNVSLKDAFSRIVEVAHDYNMLGKHASYVVPVKVDAFMSGPLILKILLPYEGFEKNWKNDFPELAEKCELEEDGESLRVTDKEISKDHESVAKFVNGHLQPSLFFGNSALWFMTRKVDSSLVFPRAAYYYIAMFILGSAVRYEPDLMLAISQLDSHQGWFIQRFIRKAERFFPQLKLCEQYNKMVYF